MQTIRLKVNDKANNKLLSSDGKGLKKECNLLKENPDLEKTKKIPAGPADGNRKWKCDILYN
ncbi:MAG: hypothetical protein RB294_11175 [Bacteroidales bacterium]|jgi:hypothetical protein|nr:hypothetical protein [Bacteroidales bacterium]